MNSGASKGSRNPCRLFSSSPEFVSRLPGAGFYSLEKGRPRPALRRVPSRPITQPDVFRSRYLGDPLALLRLRHRLRNLEPSLDYLSGHAPRKLSFSHPGLRRPSISPFPERRDGRVGIAGGRSFGRGQHDRRTTFVRSPLRNGEGIT